MKRYAGYGVDAQGRVDVTGGNQVLLAFATKTNSALAAFAKQLASDRAAVDIDSATFYRIDAKWRSVNELAPLNGNATTALQFQAPLQCGCCSGQQRYLSK